MISPHRRLRALRAIPDQDRTDEQWDELNELEIMLAPANRVTPLTAPERNATERTPRARSDRASGSRASGNRASGARATGPRPNGNAKKATSLRREPQAAKTAIAGGKDEIASAPRRKPAKRVRKKPRAAGPAEGV
jgi:hypothetical protein